MINRKLTVGTDLFLLNVILEEEKYALCEFNKNKDRTYPNLWDTMKTVLRGKFIALSEHIKKTEKAHISGLTAHLKALGKKKK